MTPSMTASVWGAKDAHITDHDDFCTITVRGVTVEVKFFLFGANAADVQSIADAFNAVPSPKAKDTQDAE